MSYRTKIEALIGASPIIPAGNLNSWLQDGQQELVSLLPVDTLWGLESRVQISAGIVGTVTVTNSGSGYVEGTTTVTFSAPENENGETAQATATVEDGAVTVIVPTNLGSGYSSAPTVTIEGDGSNATATSTLSQGQNGILVDTNSIIGVTRETESLLGNSNTSNDNSDGTIVYDETMEVECREVSSLMKGRLKPGSGWQEEASETDPVWYKEQGKVFILPTPTMAHNYVKYVTPDSSITQEDTEGALPKEIDYLVILYSAMKGCTYHQHDLINNYLPDLTAASSDFITDFSSVSLTFPTTDLESVENSYPIPTPPDVGDTYLVDASGNYVGTLSVGIEYGDITIDTSFDSNEFKDQFDAASFSLVQYIKDEDVDLASVQVQVLNSMLSKYQAEIGNEGQKFQKTVKQADIELQKAIQDAQFDQSAKKEQLNLKLMEIKSWLDIRSVKIGEIINEYQNKLQTAQLLLSEFQAKIQRFEVKKKAIQEIQMQLSQQYNMAVRSLINRYQGVSRNVSEMISGGTMKAGEVDKQEHR